MEAPADSWLSLQDRLGRLLGTAVSRVLVREIKGWASIARWLLQRTRLKPGEFSYASASNLNAVTAVVLMLLVIEGVGGFFLTRLLPWQWVSPLLLVLTIYAGIWMIGFYASLRALPHRVLSTGLLARYGALGEAWVPWRAVEAVRIVETTSPGGMDGLFINVPTATMAVGGHTNVTVRLRAPVAVSGLLGLTSGIWELRLRADRAEDFAQAVQGHISNSISGRGPGI